MHILVTGGAGYIGSHTCLALLAGGHRVTVIDNLSNSSFEALRRVEELIGKKPAFFAVDLLDKAAQAARNSTRSSILPARRRWGSRWNNRCFIITIILPAPSISLKSWPRTA